MMEIIRVFWALNQAFVATALASQLCHILAVRPQPSHFISLILNFLICQMGPAMSTSQAYCRARAVGVTRVWPVTATVALAAGIPRAHQHPLPSQGRNHGVYGRRRQQQCCEDAGNNTCLSGTFLMWVPILIQTQPWLPHHYQLSTATSFWLPGEEEQVTR